MSDAPSAPAPVPAAPAAPAAPVAQKSPLDTVIDFFRPANGGWLRIALMLVLSFLMTAVALDFLEKKPEQLLMVMRFGLASAAVAALLLLRRIKMPKVDLQELIAKAAGTEQGAGMAAIAVAIVTLAIAHIIVGVLK